MRKYWTVFRFAALSALAISYTLVSVSIGQAQAASYDLNKAKLVWTWSQGTGSAVERWVIKCGPTPANLTITKDVPLPAVRTFLLKDIPLTQGTWTCTVAAANTFGTGGTSPEVTFSAGPTPNQVDTLSIQ